MSPEAYEEVSSLGSQISAELLTLYQNKVGKGKAEKMFEKSIRISLSPYEKCKCVPPSQKMFHRWPTLWDNIKKMVPESELLTRN